MKPKIDISSKEYKIVLAILHKYLKAPARIWAFGSRVKNKAYKGSDLDLAIESTEKIPWTNLDEAFTDAPLPYKVDVVELNAIKPDFQKIIHQHKALLTIVGNIPVLRFPEFRDAGEWEVKTLGEVFDSYSGGTPKTAEKEYYGGNIPFIRSAEITKESTELFLTEKGFKNSSTKLVNKGDLLVALYGANSGDVAISKINGAINQAILCLCSDYSNSFTQQFLSFKKEWIVSKYIQGGQGNLSGEIVKSIELLFPKKSEQQKIASCLSSLDELIAAHTERLEALKDHKKGLMQNLFPQEGQKVPNYRFPEFEKDGEWVLSPFSKFIKLYRGSSPRPISDYLTKAESGVNWIKIGDTCTVTDFVIRSVSEKITPEGAEKSRKVKKGELILANSMSYGYTYQLALDGCIYDGWFVLREYEEVFDKQFLLQSLNSDYMQDQYKKLAAGGIVKNISSEIVYSTLIPNTSLKEQQKIAACLSSLDEVISAQADKLAALKTHKKGLLQQLFPHSLNYDCMMTMILKAKRNQGNPNIR